MTNAEKAMKALKKWKAWTDEDYLDFLIKHYYTVEDALKKLIEAERVG